MFVSFSIIVYGYLVAAIIENIFKMIICLSRFILQRLEITILREFVEGF